MALDWYDNEKGFSCYQCRKHCCSSFECMDKFQLKIDVNEDCFCGDCYYPQESGDDDDDDTEDSQ